MGRPYCGNCYMQMILCICKTKPETMSKLSELFDIPKSVETEHGIGVLVDTKLDSDGLTAIYKVPSIVHNIEITAEFTKCKP